MELRKFQKNEIAEIIKECGIFRHKDFTWEACYFSNEGDDESYSRLIYKDTGFYFTFRISGDHGNVHFSPGEINIYIEDHNLNWGEIKLDFLFWLKYLKKEIEEPDLWEQYLNQDFTTDTRTITDLSDEKFTEPEIERITESLNSIKVYIEEKGFAEDEQQKIYIDEQTNYLKEALDRLGRRDWFLVSITVINLVINTLNIDVENAKTIIGILKQAFVGIKGFLCV